MLKYAQICSNMLKFSFLCTFKKTRFSCRCKLHPLSPSLSSCQLSLHKQTFTCQTERKITMLEGKEAAIIVVLAYREMGERASFNDSKTAWSSVYLFLCKSIGGNEFSHVFIILACSRPCKVIVMHMCIQCNIRTLTVCAANITAHSAIKLRKAAAVHMYKVQLPKSILWRIKELPT
jgi:hypothetical protein